MMAELRLWRWWLCALFALGWVAADRVEVGAPFLAAALVIGEMERRATKRSLTPADEQQG